MPTEFESEYEGPEEAARREMRSAVQFMQAANQASDMTGACVLESWTCHHCKQQQRSAHGFCETLKCGRCGRTTASRVPRLPQPGELTAEMILEAIRMVRNIYPEVPESTREWVSKQEGAVRAIATSLACDEARRALDKIEEVARTMSGGHHRAP